MTACAVRRSQRRHVRCAGRSWLGLASLGLLLFAVATAGAETLDADAAEALVRARFFEGLPRDEAERIGPEGAARLIEMLADPAERRSHSNIVLALGYCAQPGAFEAIGDWADAPREGEIDRDTFRTWQVLPFALGHLARSDRRALERLEVRLAAPAPGWHFRHHRGARLHRLALRSVLTSLAESGLPEAGVLLDRAGRDLSDPDLHAHLEEMRALHAERRAQGRAR
ncbi:MAG: hypothetical protein JRG86_09255 [Deltaproteobacteria bacterium]|jgi:hypothetical protein|nr:hypothetical protein [Deltaproteobacteria bacterium]MBW2500238.1 hypothetical protein [Deltaproteobacteria bacterium]